MAAGEERQKLFHDIVEHLRGSCRSLTEAYAAFECEDLDNDEAFCDYLDSELFMCDDCGWWAEVGEGDGEKCEDCSDDEDED